MSGIAGILTSNTEAPRQWLGAAGKVLAHAPGASVVRRDAAPVHLMYASAYMDRDPLDVCTQAGVSLFVAGSIVNLAEVTGRPVRAAESRARALLDAYRRGGIGGLRDLNGAFVVGVWDGSSRRLHLMSDRMSLRKLYYADLGRDGLVFTSELKALLLHPKVNRSVDRLALGQFLGYEHPLGNRTLYEAIKFLTGGTRLVYAADQRTVTLETDWSPRYAASGGPQSLPECADELAARLRDAIAARIRGVRRVGIPLSGGLDSRSLLGLVRRLRPDEPLHTFTTGHGHTYDVVFARRMARVCRTRHHVQPIQEDFLARWAEPFIWLTDGMVTAHNGWAMRLTGVLPQHCDLSVIGHMACLAGPGVYVKRTDPSWGDEQIATQAARWYNVGFRDEELALLLRPEVNHELNGAAVQEFARRVREAAADEPLDRVALADLLNRQVRCISYLGDVHGAVLPVAAPFADNRVSEFLLTIPARFRTSKQAYQEMIRRHLPELARVAWEKTGLPLEFGWMRQRIHWRWETLVEQQASFWSGGTRRPHDRQAYAHYGDWMRQEPTRSYLLDTLRRGEHYLAEWCDPAAAHRIVEQHMAGTRDAYRHISALLTLVLWFDQVERRLPAVAEDRSQMRGAESGVQERSDRCDISVIIATRNRAESLRRTLQCLAAQRTGGAFTFEVLVVDNGSTDHTRQTVEQMAAGCPVPLRYLTEGRVGKPWAVNAGFRTARGAVFALTDDDTLPSPEWLAGLWACLDEERADVVTGRILPQWLGPQPAWLAGEAGRPFVFGALGCVDHGDHRLTSTPERPHYAVGGNLALRREVIDQVGDLDVRLLRGEDSEYASRCLRRGLRVVYEPDAIVHHTIGPERMSPGYFRSWWQARGYYRAYRMPWTTAQLVTLEPARWYADTGRLFLLWVGRTLAGRPRAQRFLCEVRLRERWSEWRQRVRLAPRVWAAVRRRGGRVLEHAPSLLEMEPDGAGGAR